MTMTAESNGREDHPPADLAAPSPPNDCDTPQAPQLSFADRTRQCVDEIVSNVVCEFGKESNALRKQLDDFDQLLLTRAANTKADILTFVSLVKAGHALTLHVTDRLAEMRTEVDEMGLATAGASAKVVGTAENGQQSTNSGQGQ